MNSIYPAIAFLLGILFLTFISFRTRLRRNLELMYVLVFALGYAARFNTFRIETDTLFAFINPMLFLMIGWVGLAVGFQARYVDLKKLFLKVIKLYFIHIVVSALALGLLLWLLGFKHIFLLLVLFIPAEMFVTRRLLRQRQKFTNGSIFVFISLLVGVALFMFAITPKTLLVSAVYGIAVALAAEALILSAPTEIDFLVLLLGLMLVVSALFPLIGASPFFSMFLAGVLLANMGIKRRNQMLTFLQSGEQIIFYIMLFCLGYFFVMPAVGWREFFIFAFILAYHLIVSRRLALVIFGINPVSLAIALEFYILFPKLHGLVHIFTLYFIVMYALKAVLRAFVARVKI